MLPASFISTIARWHGSNRRDHNRPVSLNSLLGSSLVLMSMPTPSLRLPPFLTGPAPRHPVCLPACNSGFSLRAKGSHPIRSTKARSAFFKAAAMAETHQYSRGTFRTSLRFRLPIRTSLRFEHSSRAQHPGPSLSATELRRYACCYPVRYRLRRFGCLRTSVGSLQIRSQTTKLSASNTCFACLLSGVDLSASVLDGSMLSGTDLSSANLSGTSLDRRGAWTA